MVNLGQIFNLIRKFRTDVNTAPSDNWLITREENARRKIVDNTLPIKYCKGTGKSRKWKFQTPKIDRNISDLN